MTGTPLNSPTRSLALIYSALISSFATTTCGDIKSLAFKFVNHQIDMLILFSIIYYPSREEGSKNSNSSLTLTRLIINYRLCASSRLQGLA
jgi:hypothetical protein